ncbi:hydroxypyruvate isomerase family protein [Paracoccus laeviglucosivorans]|uniref:Hydroxypyruvate isomerase n=1 Tax=Paracoccus laeviglucosivorans TaxID=1197861 RepID=A0A521CNE5_9RHOB|nr:TIM barrel protein [Paracoccus laeviglucosivorans]SMO60984.1 hydroxypyruvate isomerase [Paracoccus laeviglucosivorans]
MARFAANLTYLFTELPMPQRFAAAKRAGFSGVEILFPYDLPVKELTKAAQGAGLEFVLMNAPPPNWAGGPRGFAAQPGNEARFRSDFDRAIRVATALGVRHVHIMAGKADGPEARRTFIQNLKWAAARAPKTSLVIEPINTQDLPGYFLDSFDLAAEILAEVGAPNLGLQFDAYQAQMIHGDALGCWQRFAALTRHVQIAGFPGRHEPGAGDIDLTKLSRALDDAGYRGWVGAEYTPLTSTEAGLRWLKSA